ncbi:MAG TPA: hypothetical protein VF821_16905 [Lentzea sp.]
MIQQARLIDVPMAGLYPCDLDDANALLVAWGHKLGPVDRPFRSEAFTLELDGQPIAVAVSASAVGSPVAGYTRGQVVELARLGSREPWVTRVMLRLWREVCAPRWECWPVLAAISYSKNAMHRGDIYRFDGWEKIREDCGSSGGGAWSRKRYATDPVHGKKTLWRWRYDR